MRTAANSSAQTQGRVFTLTGPSGAGKSLALRAAQQALGEDRVLFSVSDTTRAPREAEQNGVHYHFVSKARFYWQVLTRQMLEWKRYRGHLYGTRKAPIEEALRQGRVVIIDTMENGVRQLEKKLPGLVKIFMMPSPYGDPEAQMETLRRRMDSGAAQGEQRDKMDSRMRTNRQQVEDFYADDRLFDYLIVNEDGKATETATAVGNIMQHGTRRKPSDHPIQPYPTFR